MLKVVFINVLYTSIESCVINVFYTSIESCVINVFYTSIEFELCM